MFLSASYSFICSIQTSDAPPLCGKRMGRSGQEMVKLASRRTEMLAAAALNAAARVVQ